LKQLLKLGTDYPPSYAAEILKCCAQMQAFKQAKGCLPEPLWYDNLGVLAFCDDGEELAHQISEGDERYTFEETQERLDRQRGFGPTTCAKFHGDNPTICEACPHWGKIKSPIVLGRLPAEGATSSDPTAATRPRWEYTAKGGLKPNSYRNTVIALKLLGIGFRHDIFHNKKIVEGDVTENLGPELSDAICRALRDRIIARFSFDPAKQNVQEAAERACEENRFDPVVDYLDALQWDGRPRLDQWVTYYLGAEDTPLNRAIGRKVLLAAVRRARQPGCKFDFVMVLEGEQGTGKSSAVRILAGEENFSDQPILHLKSRELQEALEGVWFCEISELAGLRRAEVETTKGLLSKTSDKARSAYAHFATDQVRRCILIGTTNDNTYLRDTTGNRRFWPVKTGRIDLEALQRDRDQLWAEAASVEKGREPLAIPETLYTAAAEQQEQRRMKDPWEELLENITGKLVNVITDAGMPAQEERISSYDLLTLHLGLTKDKITDVAMKRLATVMRRLGWQGPGKIRLPTEEWDQKTHKYIQTSTSGRGYWRPATTLVLKTVPPGSTSGGGVEPAKPLKLRRCSTRSTGSIYL
jgi:hypothetical protein